MLEHIFRNLNDIRVFDAFQLELNEGEAADVHAILKIIDYKDTERIQIEDSIDHLVRCKILEKWYKKINGYSGCKICLYTDKFKLPRIGKHKTHYPYEITKSDFPFYKLANNELVNCLYKAVFEYIKLYSENIQNEDISYVFLLCWSK